MAPYIKPKSLFTLAADTFSELIITVCVSLQEKYKIIQQQGLTLTYIDLVQPLHDTLLAIIPYSLSNVICESVLSWKGNLGIYMCDKKILYGVLLNDNITSLKVLAEQMYGPRNAMLVDHVVARLKNVVMLDLGEVYNEEGVLAVANLCRKLEHIVLHDYTSRHAVLTLIASCPQLRIINDGLLYISNEDVVHALVTLPDLEHLDYLHMGEVLSSRTQRGPLKLRYVYERRATPGHVLAIVNQCPHLQTLTLKAKHPSESSEILGILASSSLNVTTLKLIRFCLCNANVERFFVEKGSRIECLSFSYCCLNDSALNFVRFLGIHCGNLRELVLSSFKSSTVASFKFNLPSDKKTSFNNLKEVDISQGDVDMESAYIRNETEMIAMLLATAASIEKITLTHPYWSGGYPSDEAVEEMFSSERMTKLRYLKLSYLAMTERIARHFLENTPSLTYFPLPYGTTGLAIEYVDEMMEEFEENNVDINIEFPLVRDDDVSSESDPLED